MSESERSLEVDGHSCPFDKLPTEIVEEIFTSTSGDVDLPLRHENLPLLNLVCKKWLNIATGHHSLWATFGISLYIWKPGYSSKLRTFLHKSGSHPLRIRVDEGEEMDEDVLEVLDALIGHSERWESIRLYFPLQIQFLRKLDAVQDRLPLLQDLHITGPEDQYPTGTQHSTVFNPHNAPLLTSISLKATYDNTVYTLELPWAQLSQVQLDFPSFQTIRSKLPHSRNLTMLGMYSHIFDSVLWEYDDAVPPIRLQNLQELHAIDIDQNIADIICPSLKFLRLHGPSTSEVLTFLDNSSCRLIDIELGGGIASYSCNSSEICSIIHHTSLENLRSMSLSNIYLDKEILDILFLDARNILPFLETLSMNVKLVWRNHSDFESGIVGLRKVVESRSHARPAQGSPIENHTGGGAINFSTLIKDFTLILNADIYLKWSEYKHKWSDLEDIQWEELRSFLCLRNINQTVRLLKCAKNTHFDDLYDP